MKLGQCMRMVMRSAGSAPAVECSVLHRNRTRELLKPLCVPVSKATVYSTFSSIDFSALKRLLNILGPQLTPRETA